MAGKVPPCSSGARGTLRGVRARLAIWRSPSGGMALSDVATTAHDGSVFHVAACARSSKIAANGRWLTARTAVSSLGRSAANAGR
jgi:streptogramin lyase